jgi:hypothetical protein
VLLHRETESEMHRRLTTDAKNKELQHLLSAKEDARRAANSEAERAERERDEAEDEYKQLRKVLKKRRHAEYRRLEAERRGLEEEQQELRLRVQANEAKAAVLALKVNHEQTGPSATQVGPPTSLLAVELTDSAGDGYAHGERPEAQCGTQRRRLTRRIRCDCREIPYSRSGFRRTRGSGAAVRIALNCAVWLSCTTSLMNTYFSGLIAPRCCGVDRRG